MNKNVLYRIIFTHIDSIYEIYARKMYESEVFGFLVVEDFVFGETTSLVVDPAEERLKLEFNGVTRTFIPLHSVLRMDEVDKQGCAKIRDKSGETSKVTPFPVLRKPS